MLNEKMNIRQILKETSESVTNGHTIEKLEEWKRLLKKLDKEKKKDLKYAIKILETVIKLKKKSKESSKMFRGIFIGVLMILFIYSVSASISYKENGEMFLQGGSNNLLSIKNGLNITTGHLFISAGDLHLDGDLIHDAGDVSFSGGSFDVAGEITATKFIAPFLQSANGNLKIQANVVGDVILFSSSDVDDADDGKELKIWRNAPEGNNYIRTYITSTQNALIHSNTNILFQNAASKNIQMNSGQHIYLNLGDQAGSDELRIRDNAGLEVGTIDSNGNVWYRGDLSIGVDSDVLIQANGDSYFNGGFVGIGTTTPGLPLEIRSADDNQAIFFDSRSQAQGVGGGLAFGGKYNDAGGEAMAGRIGVQKTNGISGDVGFNMIFETQDFEGSITERMILTSDGKVGIGEESPTKTLDVGGDTRIRGNLTIDNTISPLTFTNLLGSKLDLYGSNYAIGVESNELRIASNADITFRTDGYTGILDVIIKDSGYVGIGTSDPREELHINSTHPVITFEESDASSNEKNWEIGANGEEFKIQTANDLHTGTQTALRIGNRAGTGTGFVEFPMGEIRIDDLIGSYTNGEAAVCVYNNGTLFVRDGGCN